MRSWAYSEMNLSRPNHLLMKNWTAAFWVHAWGMSWTSMQDIFSDSSESSVPLGAIPARADIMTDWRTLRPAVAVELGVLLDKPGVAAANATKLLYQKRPALIPILDSIVCGKLGGSWDLRRLDDVMNAIDVFHTAITEPENAQSLRELKGWIHAAEELALSRDARNGISPLRIYDLVAWMAGRG
jgi:hypothetical protein